MLDRDAPIYIVDTHTLFWYVRCPRQLSPAADAVFRLAAAGLARIIVPAIVVAEFYYLTQKSGSPITPSALFGIINQSSELVFSELGQAQLEGIEQIADVPEMHDRLISAEALLYQAPVISKDESLRTSAIVDVIWYLSECICDQRVSRR